MAVGEDAGQRPTQMSPHGAGGSCRFSAPRHDRFSLIKPANAATLALKISHAVGQAGHHRDAERHYQYDCVASLARSGGNITGVTVQEAL